MSIWEKRHFFTQKVLSSRLPHIFPSSVGFPQEAMQDGGGRKHGEREDREEDGRREREEEEGNEGEGRWRRAALAEKDYAADNKGNGGVEESTSEVAEMQEAVGPEEGGKEGEVEGAGEGPPVREEENDGTFVHLSNLRLNVRREEG